MDDMLISNDGRILARYCPDLGKWEVLRWYRTSYGTYDYMGSEYTEDEEYIRGLQAMTNTLDKMSNSIDN